MSPYYTILLLAFLILLAILLIRFVNNTVDREFRGLARASTDPEYRRDEIRRVDALLQGVTPIPESVPPLPGAGGGVRAAAPPALLALGVILLWGAGVAKEERELWLYGGILALALAVALMLVTLRRRKWSRTARLLLFRADLKRMDNDRAGAADDLCQLLRLTPWDDSAWAELSDDLAAQRRLPEALAAMDEAAGLDPRYDEYRMLQASLAIRLGEFEHAENTLRVWSALDGVADDDPRVNIYRAALHLARGDKASATETLAETLRNRDRSELDFLDEDQALLDIRELFPRK